MINQNLYKLLLAQIQAHAIDDVVASFIGSAKREVTGSTIAQKVEDLLPGS